MSLCITSDDYVFKQSNKNIYEFSNNIFKNYNNKLNNLFYTYYEIITYIAIIIIKKKLNIDIGLHIIKYCVVNRYDFYKILYIKIPELVFIMEKKLYYL